MKWKLTEPRFGDIVRVLAGQFYHYGIYVNDAEIIQFGPTPDARHSLLDADIRVCTSDVADFLKGGFLEVASLSLAERLKAAKPQEIVERARRQIGSGGYDILNNNCEHFVNECTFGKKASEQVDSVRTFWQNIPVLDVYVAVQPESLALTKVEPPERQAEIGETRNDALQQQRYFVWRVLEAGLCRSLGLEIKKAGLHRDDNQKWVGSGCEISLSHCKGAVCVAVSRRPVGVDIEPTEDPRYREALIERIASDEEKNMIAHMPVNEGLAMLWTRKEAAFKQTGGARFDPKKTDAADDSIRTFRIRLDRDYTVSAAGENLKNLRVYEVTGTDELHTVRRTDVVWI